MAGNIFINYRRGDDPGFTQALYSRLKQAFPAERLFMDVDNIAPGLDFVQVLNEQVARCDVLIAGIGKNSLAAADETGERSLKNPEDFVRIEIESALAQKKRVISVLVNDAKMPRSAELPDGLKPFARCNAVRLTHERFRGDTQSLIKALEQVLSEADAARESEEERARREAKAEVERLRQEKRDQSSKLREAKVTTPRIGTEPRESSLGFVGWIAGLPSESSWQIPIALVAIALLGWVLPGRAFTLANQGGLPWSSLAFFYGLAGFLAIGAIFRARRSAMGGAELALYWFALVCCSGPVFFSLANAILGQTTSYLPIAALGLVAGAALIALRRKEIGGLEFAVYWFGLTLFFYSAGTGLVASTFFRATELGAFFEVRPYRAPGILLLSAFVSALAILAWRNRRLSRPELAVYLLGIAYLFYVWLWLELNWQ